MHLEWLRIKSVRNLLDVDLQLHTDFNVFSGPNGSGKTALLEAIHCLSRCRSFRTTQVDRVVNHGQKKLQVTAGLVHPDYGRVTTGVERGAGHINIRFNKANVAKVSAQATRIPVITITPDSHELVTGTPAHRRKWLDWAMFHVEHRYIEQWRHYHKALKQRNHLLKLGKFKELDAWDAQLQDTANEINTARLAYLDELLAQLRIICQQLNVACPEVDYKQGWPPEQSLLQSLQENRQADARMGATRNGIHRSELAIKTDAGLVAHSYSRGQIKLLINALSWAQAQVVYGRTNIYPILLADDLLAELDQAAREMILAVYQAYSGQVFVTTTNDLFVTHLLKENLFHVKHGEVNSC